VTLEIVEIERKRRKWLARPLKMRIVEIYDGSFSLPKCSRNRLDFEKLVLNGDK